MSFPTNPQVHAFDEASMAETIEALPAGVRTASALAGGKPVAVAPVSLRPLFNPDLVGPEAPPPPGGLPWRYDERQVTPFAAAWTLGCVAAFASAGVVALTLHEAAGWGGLVAAAHASLPAMPAPVGTVLPVGQVVAALAALAGPPVAGGRDRRRRPRRGGRGGGRHPRPRGEPGERRAGRRARAGRRRPPRVSGALRLAPDEVGGAEWRSAALADGRLSLPPSGVASLLLAEG